MNDLILYLLSHTILAFAGTYSGFFLGSLLMVHLHGKKVSDRYFQTDTRFKWLAGDYPVLPTVVIKVNHIENINRGK